MECWWFILFMFTCGQSLRNVKKIHLNLYFSLAIRGEVGKKDFCLKHNQFSLSVCPVELRTTIWERGRPGDHLLLPLKKKILGFLGKPLNPENFVWRKHMVEFKHLISVHYHPTNHVNLQEGDVAMLSEPEGGTNRVLITIKLSVSWLRGHTGAGGSIRSTQQRRPPPGKGLQSPQVAQPKPP